MKTKPSQISDILIWAILSGILYALYIWGLTSIPDVVNESYDPRDRFSSQTEISWLQIIGFSFLPAFPHLISSLVYYSIKNDKNELRVGSIIIAYIFNLLLLFLSAIIYIMAMGSFFSFLIIALLFATYNTVFISIFLNLRKHFQFFISNAVITGFSLSLALFFNTKYDGNEFYFIGIFALWQLLSTLTIVPEIFESKYKPFTNLLGIGLLISSLIMGAPHWKESYQITKEGSIRSEWQMALKNKDQEKMKKLLQKGKIKASQIHDRWSTVVYKNDLKTVETLAKYTIDFDNQLIKESLAKVQSPEMAKLLIQLGGFPTYPVSQNHEHYQVYLPALFQINDTSILEIYIQNGANINGISQVIGFEKSTPIQHAIKSGQDSKVQFLLNHGAVPPQ